MCNLMHPPDDVQIGPALFSKRVSWQTEPSSKLRDMEIVVASTTTLST